MEKTFAMISLGCAKNLVNSEQMLYLLDEAGFVLVPEADGADFAVVNTCGFIDAAKSEAIENILQLAELKKQASQMSGKRKMFCLGGILRLSKGVASIFFLFLLLRVLW